MSSNDEVPPSPGTARPAGVEPSRREFLKTTAAGMMAAAFVGDVEALSSREAPAEFRSQWPEDVTRVWIGPEYWSNPMQDWRISDGRLELVGGGANRNVHLLTRQVGGGGGELHLAVRLGFPRSGLGAGRAGFEFGIRGPLGDYRNNSIHGRGVKAGVTADGRLFIEGGDEPSTADVLEVRDGVELRLRVEPRGIHHAVTLSAHHAETGRQLSRLVREHLPAGGIAGNVALFADGEEALERGAQRVSFADWRVSGSAVEAHEERVFGPVLFAQHTLSRGVLKLTAQMPPLGRLDDDVVRLEVLPAGSQRWDTIATASIDPLARTAELRVPGWDSSRDVPYRLTHGLRHSGGRTREYHFPGTIRRDPVDRAQLVVAGLSCMVDLGFPNADVARGVSHHDPDLLVFVGDQLYEGSGGYGVQRVQDVELATLDYLRKWYLYGWSFGALMRDRPTVCITDDHDVYHGNIWGEGGKSAPTFAAHPEGGYYMPPAWLNMVQRTQTSHLPDPYDPTPVEHGIGVYYTDLLYGRVSFALLEDRKWKSGPEGMIPPHPGRPDHITDPELDPRSLDVPGAVLLGERQHRFLDDWAADWRGAEMKVAVSQTIFAQIPNIHGEEEMWLAADLDSNGWPQTPRDEALRRIRKAFAFHLCGDQHLPMLAHYGVDAWEDASFTFCVPAIATGYPRAFRPREPGENARPGAPGYTGRFLDGLANRVTVHAVANPVPDPRPTPLERLADKASGYGIIRLDKAARRIVMECWPILSDPREGASAQYPGWPMTIDVEDNYARPVAAYLPTLVFDGIADPIVQVVEEATGEVVYTLRPKGSRFRPGVFRAGAYTVRMGDDRGWRTVVERVASSGEAEAGELRIRV